MYYTHKKSGVKYKFIMGALFQNREGVWVDCVIYENEEGMTFVRELLDWEKSFTKSVLTYDCKVCGKPFGDKLSLYYHVDEEHNR